MSCIYAYLEIENIVLNNKISRTYDYPICCSNSIFCISLVHRTNNKYKAQTENDSSVVSNDIHIWYMSLLLFFLYYSPRNSAEVVLVNIL